MTIAPTRPAVRYHGGKWRLAPWIISHFSDHRVYVEPFGGGGSVLLRKARAYAEVYNDLDGEIVNLFRVLRDRGAELREMIRLTPFARDEFDLAYTPVDDALEQARRTLVRTGMGFGANATSSVVKTGFRGSATRSGTHPATDWANQVQNLELVTERLRGVIVENRDAMDVMAYHDAPTTLHYVDPPYVHSERKWFVKGSKEAYRHEMSDDDHRRLAECLRGLTGKVILSGYPSPLYDELFGDWEHRDKEAFADGAAKRTERIWMNPAAVAGLKTLFSEGA